MMKNAFYFMLIAFFVLKTFTFLSWFYVHVVKPPNKTAKVKFKIYDVTNWITNNYNTHIAQYLKK